MRWHRVACTTLALLISATVAAAAPRTIRSPEGTELSIPRGSPTAFSRFDRPFVAWFSGRFTVAGWFHYGHVSPAPPAPGESDELQLTFEPDKEIASELPYWRNYGNVRDLFFTNESAFVRAVIPPDARKKLELRKLHSISGHATIVVEDYHTWIECDYPYYSVRFLSVARPNPVALSQAAVEEKSC